MSLYGEHKAALDRAKTLESLLTVRLSPAHRTRTLKALDDAKREARQIWRNMIAEGRQEEVEAKREREALTLGDERDEPGEAWEPHRVVDRDG